VACQSSKANPELRVLRWSCDLRSAGLASAVARDWQQKHFVHPGAGERQPTEFVGSEALRCPMI